MNDNLRGFLRTYLSYEMADDTSGYLRPTLHSCNEAYVEAVRSGLRSILDDRSMSVDDYIAVTDVEFEDEKSLYRYLEDLYAYLFENAAQQPSPPA
ncbi:hypothetical protein [Streptomyces cinnamoneus]|uniref:CdiI immunity protein domain-containing protein n=1 Tax=Streptomyces cinnamoneus TaxID=53446 RepID=A0A918U0E0_STRCJ|nr:hypothetical protein [Streptomyces cinnamoneus]GHC72396.1 hypothetical protein GCM10010507_59420 [Streptomyces cinnamoneus]